MRKEGQRLGGMGWDESRGEGEREKEEIKPTYLKCVL